MSDFKVKQKDGSETTFTMQTHLEAVKLFVEMSNLFAKMQDNIGMRQTMECALFCKENKIGADEALLLAMDGLHERLCEYKKRKEQAQKEQEQKEQEQKEQETNLDIPKNLN